jgi:hypothetical protein
MAKDYLIRNVVPQVGSVSLSLYSPSDKIYDVLYQNKEINRLSSLRQLGALSAFPMSGARLARWDYTVTLLHYSQMFNISGFNSTFRIGKVEFTSAISALQCLSLIWNIGHLPGTFSSEKGVYRYLKSVNEKTPVEGLVWPFHGNPEVNEIRERANSYLLNSDYAGVCRVLSVIKLLSYCQDENDYLFSFITDFAAPFTFNYEKTYSSQWRKLRKAFSIIRHLSYLTVDLPFSGHRWAPNIPDLLEHYVTNKHYDLDYLAIKISELLSPIEKNIYDTIYHSEAARREAAIFANKVEEKLKKSSNASDKINKWICSGLIRDLKLGRLPNREGIKRCVSIQLRSHFSSHPDSCIDLEAKLRAKKFSHSVVFEYKSWNSSILLEPDELIIDILVDRDPTPTDIGMFLYWFTREFDDTSAAHNDFFYMTRKGEIEVGYYQILSRAIETQFPHITLKLDSWQLNRFGLFSDFEISDVRGSIWLASAEMDDPISKHLTYDRSKKVSPDLRDQYKELLGIRELRNTLKKKWKGKKPRCRWLLVTSSVKFLVDNRSILEFDGGLIRVSARSGKLTWYGLNCKRDKHDICIRRNTLWVTYLNSKKIYTR